MTTYRELARTIYEMSEKDLDKKAVFFVPIDTHNADYLPIHGSITYTDAGGVLIEPDYPVLTCE